MKIIYMIIFRIKIHRDGIGSESILELHFRMDSSYPAGD